MTRLPGDAPPPASPCLMYRQRQWFAMPDDDEWWPTYSEEDEPDDGLCQVCEDAEWVSVMWSIEYEEYFFYCTDCEQEMNSRFDDLVTVD